MVKQKRLVELGVPKDHIKKLVALSKKIKGTVIVKAK
ncbi:hypothetical protein SAMN05877753_1057 [Bacillus oleivorans]|uniref:Uncharacterized protein n=1 Tax=Bacillus oleivorans TaxID=1448271 RepID=A0A285CUD8_9BACI|nr:hypothetical protein SAMN05877753_1057 [Bacillus oleivorans]